MTRDDIIRMARKANLHERVKYGVGYVVRIPNLEKLERFAALVAAAEREACAKLCEQEQFELTEDVTGKNALQLFDSGCRCCAEMIRRRGET
jgi:hypothetical protein